MGDVPLGAWVLYRPVGDAKTLEVTAYHEAKPSVVVSVSWYDVKSGELIRSKNGGRDGDHGHHGKHGKSDKKKG